jgi:hypothetical protein
MMIRWDWSNWPFEIVSDDFRIAQTTKGYNIYGEDKCTIIQEGVPTIELALLLCYINIKVETK